MTKAALKKAVEHRTQQRLAARKEAAKKSAETRRAKREEQIAEAAAKLARRGGKTAPKKHEDELVAETRKMLDAEAAAKAEGQQPEVGKQQTKRPEATTAQKGRAGGAMATVALRGESAERFRALAAAQQMTLSKLLVRMMEGFEAQAR